MPEYPHVTRVLARAGLVDTTWYTQEAADRGSAVHAACALLDEDDLHWPSLDASILLRVRQYQRFREEVRPEIHSIEEAVVNDDWRYCGRLDRVVTIGGRRGVLDIKSITRAPWQGVQVAMYAACFKVPLARWTLHLSDDHYRLIEHRDPNDWKVAQAALAIAAWKEAHSAV